MSELFDATPLMFPSPWSARAFAIVSAVAESGLFDPRDFQKALIAAISVREASGSCIGDEESYYDCWIESLTHLVHERGVSPMKLAVAEAGIRERVASLHAVRGHHHHDPSVSHHHHHHDHAHGSCHEGSPQPIFVELPR